MLDLPRAISARISFSRELKAVRGTPTVTAPPPLNMTAWKGALPLLMRILGLMLLAPWALLFSAELQPIAVANFDAPGAGGVLDAAPVFLSEDSIAIMVRDRARVSEILVFRLSEGKLQLVSRAGTFVNAQTIVAVSGKRPLVTSRGREAVLYSPDLGQQRNVQTRVGLFLRPFPGSKMIGQNAPWFAATWELIELSPEVRTIRKGQGQLLSVSDQAIAVRREDTLFFETPEGHPLGSMLVPADTKGAVIGEIAGENRFLLDLDDRHEIVSFQGKSIAPISRPPGWGFRRGWSDDGRRLLLDHYTRTVSAADLAIEALASAIVPVPEHSNGELISVIDTVLNKGCFRLVRTPGVEYTLEGGKHADISPSGRLLVVATLSKLAVYRLPETCSGMIE